MRPTYLEGREVTGNMRAILIDWLVQVQIKFRLLQETMYMTVAIIDRFLQVCRTLSTSMPVSIPWLYLTPPPPVPGPSSPQEAASACWRHIDVHRLKI